MSINSITLVGRAGRDPEVRYFESGSVVAQFSIATNRYKADEDPDWHNIKVWGKSAQVAADYVRKGHLVGVTGRLEYEKWTDSNTGEARSKPVVVADRIQLLTSKSEAAKSMQQDGFGGEPSEEEVPF